MRIEDRASETTSFAEASTTIRHRPRAQAAPLFSPHPPASVAAVGGARWRASQGRGLRGSVRDPARCLRVVGSGRWLMRATAAAGLSVVALLGVPGGVAALTVARFRAGMSVPVSGPSPYQSDCNGAGSRPTGAAGEPTLAINPRDPRDLVAAWMQDVDSNGAVGDEVGVSLDGGQSWTRESLSKAGRCNGGETQYAYLADPWLSFGPRGVVWLSTLPYTTANPGAIAVDRSTDGGRSFGPPVYVDRDQTALSFDDKPAIMADPTDPRRAYVTWVKQQVLPPPLPAVPLSSTIYFARTLDGGVTWTSTAIATVSAPAAFAGGIVTSLPSGQLLLTYPQITPQNPLACIGDQECRGQDTVIARRSWDHGATWSAPTVAARYMRSPVHDNAGVEVKASADQYSLAVDPHGVAYLAAHDETDAPNSHIIVMRSTDGGASWARVANADSASPAVGAKLQPIIAAGPKSLGVLYYDFRDAIQRGGGRAEYSWWFDHSENGGVSWREQRVTGPSDLHSALGTPLQFGHFIGDYFDLQPDGQDFIAVLTLAKSLSGTLPTQIFSVHLHRLPGKGLTPRLRAVARDLEERHRDPSIRTQPQRM